MDNPIQDIPSHEAPPAPLTPEQKRQRRAVYAWGGLAVVLILALVAGAVVLFLQDGETTARIRDLFIIFMALESLAIGVTLLILIIQLARLINLLQNEIKPILASTNETVNTMRGTVTFLSDNLSEPVMKLNQYLAGFAQLRQIFRITREK